MVTGDYVLTAMSKKNAAAQSPSRSAYEPSVLFQPLEDDGTFPNSRLASVLYRLAVKLAGHDPAAVFEQLFAENGWDGSWLKGIYPFHHYHSTAHEVLGVYRGSVKVRLGGERGVVHDLGPGDVVIMPAGVAHNNLRSTGDFGVVGAYPQGQSPDMNYGRPGERPRSESNFCCTEVASPYPCFGTRRWRGRAEGDGLVNLLDAENRKSKVRKVTNGPTTSSTAISIM